MKHGSPMAEFTRLLADIERTVRRRGPRSAVTPELLRAGQQLLAEGVSVRAMCERLGVHQRSWYRVVRPEVASPPRQKRNKQAIPRKVVVRLKALRREGLTLPSIAERLGLHINTVNKYCGQLGLIERRPCGCALKGRPIAGCTLHERTG